MKLVYRYGTYVTTKVHVHLCLHVIGIFKVSEHIPADEHVINTAYHMYTLKDSGYLSNNPVKEPIRSYAEVTIPTTEVKMTPNPADVVT